MWKFQVPTALALASAAIAMPGLAAASPDEPIYASLDYDAAPGCPTRAAFEQHVARRTLRVSFVTSGPSASRFRVTLARQGHGYMGQLSVEPAHAAKPDAIQGQSCADVASAIGLSLALLVDPHAALEAAPPALPPAPPPPPARVPLEPSKTAPEQPAQPSESGLDHSRWLALIQGGLRSGIGPQPSAGAGASVVHWWRRSGFFTPAIRVEGMFHTSSRGVGSAVAGFRLMTLAIAACPARTGFSSVNWLPLCAGIEAGALAALSRGLARNGDIARFWTAAQAMTTVAVVGAHAAVEFTAGVVIPLRRYEFVFEDPSTTVFRTPSLAGYGEVAFGLSFD